MIYANPLSCCCYETRRQTKFKFKSLNGQNNKSTMNHKQYIQVTQKLHTKTRTQFIDHL